MTASEFESKRKGPSRDEPFEVSTIVREVLDERHALIVRRAAAEVNIAAAATEFEARSAKVLVGMLNVQLRERERHLANLRVTAMHGDELGPNPFDAASTAAVLALDLPCPFMNCPNVVKAHTAAYCESCTPTAVARGFVPA